MKYFEDFAIGDRIELGQVTVSQNEIIEFARKYDPQYFHIDPEAAKKSIFGGLAASGWHTSALFMRQLVDHFLSHGAALGSPGIDELRWTKPVYPGDTLSFAGEIVASVPSRSKPDRGLLEAAWRGVNQRGETVMTLRAKILMGRRPAGRPAP